MIAFETAICVDVALRLQTSVHHCAGPCAVQGPLILIEMVVQRLIRKSGWQVNLRSRFVSSIEA
jgi:hypothetical protein